jgi:hypothetical protein
MFKHVVHVVHVLMYCGLYATMVKYASKLDDKAVNVANVVVFACSLLTLCVLSICMAVTDRWAEARAKLTLYAISGTIACVYAHALSVSFYSSDTFQVAHTIAEVVLLLTGEILLPILLPSAPACEEPEKPEKIVLMIVCVE